MDINNLSKNELIKKIINQANSLNKKVKRFSEKDITEHKELVDNLLGNIPNIYNDKGTITKSTLVYKEMDTIWLKRTLSTLHKLNNHDIYGTINKYEKVATQSWKTLKSTVEEQLREKGYNEQFIFEVTNQKDFYNKLYLAFKDAGKNYSSEQDVEKIALDYSTNGISEEEKTRVVTSIEKSKNDMDYLTEEIKTYAEFLNERGKNRR